jgi:hypothetical protein
MALRAIHEFDSALRYAFETGAHDRGVAFVVKDHANRVIPCAPSKILASDIVALRPGGAYLPFGFQTRSKTTMTPIIQRIEHLIPADALNGRKSVKVSTETAIKLIDLVESCLDFETGYGFDWGACRAAVEYFSRITSPLDQRNLCWIIAETGRTLSRIRAGGRYSDAPYTYQDREVAQRIGGSLPVLAMFRQEGREEDGWRGTPFWWPVLFAPAKAAPSVFASTIRDNGEAADNDGEEAN